MGHTHCASLYHSEGKGTFHSLNLMDKGLLDLSHGKLIVLKEVLLE